jgi:flagellar basal body-associated protein FliL
MRRSHPQASGLDMAKILALPLILLAVLFACVLGLIVWIFRRRAIESDLASRSLSRLEGLPEPEAQNRPEDARDDRRDDHRPHVGTE